MEGMWWACGGHVEGMGGGSYWRQRGKDGGGGLIGGGRGVSCLVIS